MTTVARRVEQREDERKLCFFMGVDYASDHQVFSESIHDISANGLFIETQKALPAGTAINMVFTDYDKLRLIKIPGKVLRASERGIAVRFTFNDKGQRSFINNVVQNI